MAIPEPAIADSDARVHDACAELSRAWRSGENIAVEKILNNCADILDDDCVFELIYTEIALREEFGQPLTREKWFDRFPQYRNRLERLLDLHEAMRSEPWSVTSIGVDTKRTRTPTAPKSELMFTGYELIEEIGRGGMGIVYKAYHRQLDRLAAVKLIRDSDFSDPQDCDRLLSEAKAAAQLQHANIAQIYEVGQRDGRPFLAMEYVAGQSLAERLRTGPLPSLQAAELLIQLAKAVEFAHKRGVVHRDLKPANILLSDSPTLKPDTVKIVDFGLAKRLNSTDRTRLTGSIIGTPCYMAPEQTGAGSTRPATDIWALGAILYECLTGRPPFQGPTALDILDQVRAQDPVPPSRLIPNLPRDLETICLKCLRREPANRYESADALADDLGRFQRGESVKARPVGNWEVMWKWMKRRPLVAGLLATLLVLTISGGTVFAVLWRHAETARANEKAQRELTEENLAGKVIGLSRFAWMSNDLDQARKSLAECPEKYRDREWRYLDRVCNSEFAVLRGTIGTLRIDFSPNSQRILGFFNAGDDRIRVWDVNKKQEIVRISKSLSALDASFNDAEDQLSVVCYSGRDNLGYCSPIELKTIDFKKPGNDGVKLDVSMNRIVPPVYDHPRRRVAVVDATAHVIRYFDSTNGQMLWSEGEKLGPIAGASISPGGNRVASTTVNGLVYVFNAKDGHLICKFSEPKTTIPDFLPDERRIAYASQHFGKKPQIVVRDTSTNKDILRVTAPTSAINRVAVSRDGKWIAALASIERVVIVFDARTGKERLTFRGARDKLNSMAFSPDSRLIAAGADNGEISIWRVDPIED